MIRASEIMAKIKSHASLLKCDDVRLKHLPYGNRACSLCDLYLVEDIFHITMQCPGRQQLRSEMFTECELYPDVNEVLKKYDQDTMSLCLGKCPTYCSYDVMERLWCITGKHISGIYEYVLDQRQGVGNCMSIRYTDCLPRYRPVKDLTLNHPNFFF